MVMHAGPLWNEVLRVPLVIHAPHLPPRVVRDPVQHIDIPPTILALLGLPAHPAFQGVNVLKETSRGHGPVFTLAQKPWTFESAIILNGFKLVHDWTGSYRLFDLRQDPGEKVNLIGQRPEEFRQLHARLKRWHALQLFYYLTPDIHQRFYPPSTEQIELLLLASLAEPRP
jgi:arylsulfatase A-like enzyme